MVLENKSEILDTCFYKIRTSKNGTHQSGHVRTGTCVMEGVMHMEKNEYQIIAVDFDGTLCVDCYPQIGAPNLYLIQILKNLRNDGKEIILWTCRCGEDLEAAVEWCRGFELEFDAVNQNVERIMEQYGTDSRKIFADVYLDDKACFPWKSGKEWRNWE